MNFNVSSTGINNLTWIQVAIYFLCILVPFTTLVRRGKTLSKKVKRLRNTIGFLGFIVLVFDMFICVLFFTNLEVPEFIQKYPYVYKYGIIAFAYIFWLFFKSSVKKEVMLESFDFNDHAYDVMDTRKNNEMNAKDKYMNLDAVKEHTEELEVLDIEEVKEETK